MGAIGIDLGTTNCCVSYVKDDTPVIIPNETGFYTTPSYISFIKNEIIFGETAKKRRVQNEKNTIYDVKRFIGCKYEDENVQKFVDKWKFGLVNLDGHLNVKVSSNGIERHFSPEMLSGLLLKHLKNQAQRYIGNDVDNVYITVPTYFNDAQRQATIDAARIAGFQEIRLINEPTAAAIAYSMENCSRDERQIFVFDFGGGTFDVSLIKFANGNVDVIAIDGDVELGGNDVTQNLVKHYAKVISDQYKLDVFKDARKYYRFEAMCEDVKRQLSDSVEATLQIFDLIAQDVEITVTREEFEKINDTIFAKTIEIVDRCLKKAEIEIASIDDVVVVGGSTRIKKITQSLENYFKKPLQFTINADQAVAMGAAIAACKWAGNQTFADVTFKDICPYSLGVEIIGSHMSTIIPKNSTLPATANETYCSRFDWQPEVGVKIFLGENKYTKYNTFLGKLSITGFEPGPAGSIKFNVTFTLDTNGILSVEVDEPSTGKKNVNICLDKGRLSEIDLQQQTDTIEEVCNASENVKDFKEMHEKVAGMCNEARMREKAETLCDSTLAFLKELDCNDENFQKLKEKYATLLEIRETLE